MKKLSFLILTACSSTESVLIESSSPGARIVVNENYVGDSPITTEIPEGKTVSVWAYPKQDGLCGNFVFIGANQETPKRVFIPIYECSKMQKIDPALIMGVMGQQRPLPQYQPTIIPAPEYGPWK